MEDEKKPDELEKTKNFIENVFGEKRPFKDRVIDYLQIRGERKWRAVVIVLLFISIQVFIGYSVLYTIPETKKIVICQQYMWDNCAFARNVYEYCYLNATIPNLATNISR